MAFSLPFSPLILGIFISIFISLFSPSHSAVTCASQKLPSNRTYANCTDLPTLGATLHFTYNATNSSLTVAYAASPPKSDGWVAWGINPTGGGMVGTQALMAFKPNGTVVVQPFNLTSYKKIDPVKNLSLETWDIAAEEAGGVITIFAGVKLPEKADNFSHVWQVGPVNAGVPSVHEFKTENLQSRASLSTVVSTAIEKGNTSSSGGGNTTATDKSSAVLMMGERFGLGFYLGLVLVLLSVM
ncbi:auxin-induced in root cultures protein 12 [Gastrolobium bilobum]|uniref:auxin-induced in root cultures protein 12 n=1 Tax=Gastrolobium bilobum TaxID=150636 RepID=UPI002AB086C3|nr:auxin-induced in root cultures protein 12 [Gastrolobium bilobum]